MEFVVSVGILGLVIGFMVELIPFSHVANHRAWDSEAAQSLARTQMATMRATDFDKLASQAPVQQTVENTAYTTTVTVAPYGSYPSLKEVTVLVQWHQNGGDRQLVLRTLLSRSKVAH